MKKEEKIRLRQSRDYHSGLMDAALAGSVVSLLWLAIVSWLNVSPAFALACMAGGDFLYFLSTARRLYKLDKEGNAVP